MQNGGFGVNFISFKGIRKIVEKQNAPLTKQTRPSFGLRRIHLRFPQEQGRRGACLRYLIGNGGLSVDSTSKNRA